MQVRLIAPLVYFYSEDHAELPEENCPDVFNFGNGFKLEKIDKEKDIVPLLKEQHDRHIFSKYQERLILDYAGYAIKKDYKISQKEAADTGTSSKMNETKRLLSLLRMALGITKKTHLIFQDFHIDSHDGRVIRSSSLNQEGSYWSAQKYYPVELDVSYTLQDLKKTKKAFEILVGLSENYSRVFNACYYFEMGRLKGDGDYRLQFTLFVTSLESIFNTSSTQVAESLAIKYAYFLYSEPTERIKAYKNMKEIYKLRSHIVHGQQIPNRFLNLEIQDRLLGDLEYNVRTVINHILSNELVDEINSSSVDDYFAEMVLG